MSNHVSFFTRHLIHKFYESGVTICYQVSKDSKPVVSFAIAKQAKEDEFDPAKGRLIAKGRLQSPRPIEGKKDSFEIEARPTSFDEWRKLEEIIAAKAVGMALAIAAKRKQ